MSWEAVLQAWLFKDPGGILRTRSILALLLVGTICFMWAAEIEVLDAQLGLTIGVVTFYFTGRLKSDLNATPPVATSVTTGSTPVETIPPKRIP